MPRRPDVKNMDLIKVWGLPPLTIDEVRQLPVSCPLAYAARACDIGRTAALRMANAGALDYMGQQIKVHKVGREWKVALPDLLAVLGIEQTAPSTGGSAEPAA